MTNRRRFLANGGVALAGLFAGETVATPLEAGDVLRESVETPPGHIVERIEAFKVVVPMKLGSVYSEDFGPNLYDWSFDLVPKFLIRVHTSSGLVGLGETARGTEDDALRQNIAYLLGKDLRTLNPAAPKFGLPNEDTSDAFEIAYHDILGKALGVPVHVLLGGQLQDKIAVAYWTGQRTVEDLPTIAARAVDLGFKHLKFKARHGDPVVEQVEAVTKRVPQLGLTVDFNESYASAEDFLPIGRGLDDFHIMLEDPVPRVIESFIELREKLNNPLVLTPLDQDQMMSAITRGACDILNIGGSMRQFIKQAYVAELARIPVWHGSGIELGVRDMSFVHAIAATRSCTVPSDLISYLRQSDILVDPLRIVDGFISVPQSPGLGVELDDDKVRFYEVPMGS